MGGRVPLVVVQAIHDARRKGMVYAEIASIFRKKREWARRIVKNYGELAGERIVERKQGRSRKTTPEEDQAMLQMAKLKRVVPAKDIARALMETEGANVNRRTVQRRLKEFTGRTIVPVNDDLSESHKQARVNWCTKAEALLKTLDAADYCRDVLFSDEVMWTLDSGRVKVSGQYCYSGMI